MLCLASMDNNDNDDDIPHTRNVLYGANEDDNDNGNKAYYKAKNADQAQNLPVTIL